MGQHSRAFCDKPMQITAPTRYKLKQSLMNSHATPPLDAEFCWFTTAAHAQRSIDQLATLTMLCCDRVCYANLSQAMIHVFNSAGRSGDRGLGFVDRLERSEVHKMHSLSLSHRAVIDGQRCVHLTVEPSCHSRCVSTRPLVYCITPRTI